jgi:hypothetical protein
LARRLEEVLNTQQYLQLEEKAPFEIVIDLKVLSKDVVLYLEALNAMRFPPTQEIFQFQIAIVEKENQTVMVIEKIEEAAIENQLIGLYRSE